MDKGLISKDMIEYSGRLDDDEHTEEDLFEMFEILSYIYYENDLDGTYYEMAEA
jgi:hypothetical protein